MTPGTVVRVLAPFDEAFPGTYIVEWVEIIDEQTVVHLDGVESAFDPKYLEAV